MKTQHHTDRTATFKPLETGTLVAFDIVKTDVEPSPGRDETVVNAARNAP